MAAPTLLSAALDYAERGFPVFPCDPATKRPFTGKGGFKNASTDPAVIRAWWAHHPDAMIAMPTGEAIGAWVLDVDDPAVFESGCTIELPATRRCNTGKGYHLYFSFDPAHEVRNAQIRMVDGERRWPFPDLPGAEVRGNGGYVIAAPSIHPSGRPYVWAHEGDPSEPPAELLRIVRKESAQEPASAAKSAGRQNYSLTSTDSAYGLSALDGECRSIRQAANGAQEVTLNDAALKIGGLVSGGELSKETARRELIAAGVAMSSHNSNDKWTLESVTIKVERGMSAAHARKAPERMRFGPPPANDDHRRFDPDTGEIFDDEPDLDPREQDQPHDDDPEPIDLWARYDAPKLPSGLLPPIIEMLAFKQGHIMGVDPAGLAMAALTVCAAAIDDDIAVQMKRHDPSWTESARLWVGMVGLPSRKKSPVLTVAVRPLARIDGRKMAAYAQAMNERSLLSKAEQKDAPMPAMHRHVVSDATIESLQQVLKDSPWGVLSEQDELSGWFGSMDKYSGNKGAQADRAFYLKAFNGGRYTVDRVARGSSQIRNLSISLIGGIQPEPLRKVATESVDDGLIQRLLPVILAPATVGHDVPNDGIVERYNQLIENLVDLRTPAATGIPTLAEQEHPARLQLSADARTVRERLEQEHHDLVSALENTSPKLAAHFGKYDGLFGRLCVIWHCIEHAEREAPPVEITERTALLVAEFMERFTRPSAIAFYAGMLGLSDGHDTLLGLASYIIAEQIDVVNARVVQRSTRALQSFTADQARLLCEKLENFGWLVPLDPPARSSTPRWRVVPAVHEMFADKGRQDAERRKTAHAALQAALGR